MSAEIVQPLLEKRSELAAEVAKLQSAIFHIDETLAVFGHRVGSNKTHPRLFAHGELIAFIGEAERAGCKTNAQVVEFIMRKKGFDLSDAFLKKRVAASVKDCRKRLNKVGA